MKQEKAKMRRIGGFLLEILVLIFVFTYSHTLPETGMEKKSDPEKQETSATHIAYTNSFSFNTLKDGSSKVKTIKGGVVILNHEVKLTRLSTPVAFISAFKPMSLFHWIITINAP